MTKASNFGDAKEIFNGVDLTVNARLKGLYLAGGVSTGSTLTDTCFVVDSPQASFSTAGVREAGLYQCRNRSPWAAGTQVKFSAIYTLPWQIRTSLTYQNVAGIPLTASYVASNAAIQPSLGRNLAACRGAAVCTATALVDLMPNNQVYREGRNTQLNVRLSRIVQRARAAARTAARRLQPDELQSGAGDDHALRRGVAERHQHPGARACSSWERRSASE